MKKIFFVFAFSFFTYSGFSQNMNTEKMGQIFKSVSDSIQGGNGQWQFQIKKVVFMCVTDTKYNRMRIISPIAEAKQIDEKLKSAALIANFHSALDVKYAIADDILWSVFIHPLKELSEAQVKDAIKQVYSANVTFGTTFSSTDLVFPGNQKKEEKKKEKKLLKKEF
tara:strand:+ start:115376 stop:115876 length:501 start_codon:yes stop_codon:yes gene_type:complete